MLKKNIIIIIALSIYAHAFSQKSYSKFEQSYIISINTFYSSNLINFNSNGYDDLYLITSPKSFKIDTMMCSLSKKKYSSLSEIIRTLSNYFKVYIIVKDTAIKKGKTDKIIEFLVNSNKYKTGYLFALADSVKKYSSVHGYLIQRTPVGKKIKYRNLERNCDSSTLECKAIIEEIL